MKYQLTPFLVIQAVITAFADDFIQITNLYQNSGTIILPKPTLSIFKLDIDFDFEMPAIDDFYFSVCALINYR